MARRGYRLYSCGECQEKSWHHWIERNRAARMRCPRCGGVRLELVSAEARADAADLNALRIEGHRDMSPPPERPGRKVT